MHTKLMHHHGINEEENSAANPSWADCYVELIKTHTELQVTHNAEPAVLWLNHS